MVLIDDIIKNISNYPILGTGGFATVYKVDNNLALKVSSCTNENDIIHARKEYSILKYMATKGCHDSIIKVYDYKFILSASMCYVLMEYANGPTLFDFLMRYGPINDPEEGINLTNYLIDGMNCMHSFNLYHRDIKSNNILIDENTHKIKYIDFNISCNNMEEGRQAGCNIGGTPPYMSPTIWKLYNSGIHINISNDIAKKGDYWSLGVTLYFIFTGVNIHTLPFMADEPEFYLNKQEFQNLSPVLKDKVIQLLKPELFYT